MGQIHRIDGPAIEAGIPHLDRWYVNNTRITSWQQLKTEAILTNEKILELVLIYQRIYH